MTPSKILFVIGLFACLSQANSLSCRNEKGEEVDYFVLLKPPKQKHESAAITNGGGYGFKDNTDKAVGWKLSDKDIGDVNSYIGQTFKEVYFRPELFSYIQYNDAKPSEEGDSSIYAHAKGALVFDNENMIWITHSVPKFLPIFHLKKYEFPETGRTHGQNFMCVTFKTKNNVNKILDHFVTMKIQVYGNHISKKLNEGITKEIMENINILAKVIKSNKGELPKGAKVDENRVKELTTELRSKGGERLIIISKSRKDDVDIWSKLVSPALQVKELAVKTWTLLQKAASLISTTCSRKERIINVLDMDVKFVNNIERVDWGKNDHSKWALCIQGGSNCYCQGDMNRATSQKKRGGGALCIFDKTVHDIFERSFTTKIGCTGKLEYNRKKK